MTRNIYSIGWNKQMPKASKVDRSEAEFIPSTTPKGSNVITTTYSIHLTSLRDEQKQYHSERSNVYRKNLKLNMTKDIYSIGWNKQMPKASKVDRSEVEFIPSTTPSGSNNITTTYSIHLTSLGIEHLKKNEIEHDQKYLFNWME